MSIASVGRFNARAIGHSKATANGYRQASTALHFYQHKQLDLYASQDAKRLTLRQLVFFGRSMDEERLIKSANYVRTELPVRIAHRLRDLQTLPYIVVTQEGVAKVYELYWSAFERLRKYPVVRTLEENEKFCDFLTKILHDHVSVIPNLSLGLSLASRNLPPEQLDSFMRRMLVSRISRRVLAEHHIALSEAHWGKASARSDNEPHVGIIYTALNVKRSIDMCASLLRDRPHDEEEDQRTPWPEVIVDGHTDTTFAYIREHLEYIIFELLKNAMRATVLKYPGTSTPPPIIVTIASSANEVVIRISDQGGGLTTSDISSPGDLFSFSHIRNAVRLKGSRLGALRTVSSSKQGVRATITEQVARWQSPSVRKNQQELQPRIGLGLPMGNIYATYFGGALDLVSLNGWGTDVYLRVPKLGTNLEGIEV